MPEPTVQAFRFIGMPTVRMKEDGSAPGPCRARASCLGDAFRQLVRQLFAGNVHMSKFHLFIHAISAKEMR